MALPPFLLIEVRAAFRTCGRQNGCQKVLPWPLRLPRTRFVHTTSAVYRSPTRGPSMSGPETRLCDARKAADPVQSGECSTQLTPGKEKKEALETGRKVEVPLRVIPPAKISATAKLKPQERLHIEHMTRHPPPKKKMPGFRETVLVYHLGNFKVMWMIFLRVFATTTACTMATIWMPAYYNYGVPVWILAAVGIASLSPAWILSYWFRGIITEIRLKLPPSARESAKTAMEYARNLPRDATIEARYQHWTSIPSSVVIKVGDTVPISTKITQPPANFKWVGRRVDRGSWLLPVPTNFWVGPRSSPGLAARTTVPGLWEALYKRLTGLDASSARKLKG